MKAREYAVLEMAVEQGVASGMRRAYKHNDAPTAEQVSVAVVDSVVQSICDWFEFPVSDDE